MKVLIKYIQVLNQRYATSGGIIALSSPNGVGNWFHKMYTEAESYELYQEALQRGVAPEHARMLLHLNHYTHWIWKQDLHNLMHFLSLRDHPHAQVEAQAYAKAIDQLIRQVLPHSMELYDKYRRL